MAEKEIDIAEGEVSKEQLEEIQEGKWHTVKDIAHQYGYTTAWVSSLCQSGRIKAIKPIGGQWRIPEEEYNRILKEGLPPLPRKSKREKEVITLGTPKASTPKEAPDEKKEGEDIPFPWSIFGMRRSK